MIECQPSLLASGIPSIEWIATHLRVAWLTPLIQIISDLGTEGGVIFSVALAYWLWNKRYTRYLGYAMFTSLMLNLLMKGWIMECRPPSLFWLEAIKDGSFSFPSGHTQVATPLWLGFAYYVRHRGLAFFYLLIGLLIALSRPYLGVHFPHDVAVGMLLGLSIFGFFIYAEQKYWERSVRYSFIQRCCLLSLFFLIYLLLCHQITVNIIATLAAFTGFWLGCQCEMHWLKFTPPHTVAQHLKLLVIGLLGIAVLWKGFIFLGKPTDTYAQMGLYVVQYSLLGWWITFAAPYLAQHHKIH